jgi:predicted nucleotidyltransferase
MKTLDADLLQAATQRLVDEFHPEQIWLFGSHAWGTPTEDSDVDLMVVVKQSDEGAIRRSQRALRCLGSLRLRTDVIVPTRAQVDRYKHLRASLFHQVLNEGRKLYG